MRRSTRLTRQPDRYDPADYSTDETESEASEPMTDTVPESDSTGSLAEFITSDSEVEPIDELKHFLRAMMFGCDPNLVEHVIRKVEAGQVDRTRVSGLIKPQLLNSLAEP